MQTKKKQLMTVITTPGLISLSNDENIVIFLFSERPILVLSSFKIDTCVNLTLTFSVKERPWEPASTHKFFLMSHVNKRYIQMRNFTNPVLPFQINAPQPGIQL